MTCTTPLLSVFISKMLGRAYSRERYDAEQAWLRDSGDRAPIDRETGLALYIQDLPTLLSRLDVDVLALFGEKDRHVDWRKTRALYASTLGANRHATLTVMTFPDGNHNIDVCETGSMREIQANDAQAQIRRVLRNPDRVARNACPAAHEQRRATAAAAVRAAWRARAIR